MYTENEKGEIVDEKGELVTSVNILVEKEPSESEEEDESDEFLESEEDQDRTLLCEDTEAEGIAINRAMERLVTKYGEEVMHVENIWKYFMALLEEEDFSKAFEILLRYGDDFYFLRGCLVTGGKVLRRLHKRVGQRVVQKLCQIKLAGRLDVLNLNFIERGVKYNYLDRTDIETNNDTEAALEVIAQGFDHVVKDRAEYVIELVQRLKLHN